MISRDPVAGSKDLMVAFPTKEEKDLATGKIKEIPKRVIYTYWTNFDRREPESWTLLEAAIIPDKDEWWGFKTNISPADFEAWTKEQTRLFLKQMWEIYRYRKVG